MKRSTAFYVYIVLAIIYVALVMILPTDPATLHKYNISQGQARLLNMTIVLPLLGIWYMAVNGFIRFRSYAKAIRTTDEGWAFTLLSFGLMGLAFMLPVNSIVSALFNYLSFQNSNFLPTATILKNYIGLAFAIVSFGLLARGATQLIISKKNAIRYEPVLPLFSAPLIIVLSSVFTWLVVIRPADDPGISSGYYLPNWLIIVTIIVPYLAAWLGGILALYYLNVYRRRIHGTIYKQAFGQLAFGIGVVTSISVLLQFLTTISSHINKLQLTPILTIIYVLLLLYIVGYRYIAHGSKKLHSIEDV